ncbi:hypothetical protein [Clostridium algidicarnis]|uniref:hypothetical protein n=1 Tax=Clostridium algidicarnis TaxID=37659 RepID=UPI000496710D|nr:hypothetical protein [Clostridium algidicarnis]
MKMVEIPLSDALDKRKLIGDNFEYALIYALNEVKFGRLKDIDICDKELLIEGRIFNKQKELHIFRCGEDLKAVLVEDEKEDDTFEEKQLLEEWFGKEIKIKHYIAYDKNDNQAYIDYTRLCGAVMGGE